MQTLLLHCRRVCIPKPDLIYPQTLTLPLVTDCMKPASVNTCSVLYISTVRYSDQMHITMVLQLGIRLFLTICCFEGKKVLLLYFTPLSRAKIDKWLSVLFLIFCVCRGRSKLIHLVLRYLKTGFVNL